MENLDVMQYAVRYNAFLLRQIEYAASSLGGVALDFGAGNGRFIAAARSVFDTVHAIETDCEYQSVLREMGGAGTVSDRLATITDESIDVAWSFNVFEHIQDDQSALNELVAKLKPGGRIVIFVPAFPCLYSRMDALVGHVRRYTVNELRSKAEVAGLAVSSIGYADSVGFFASAAYRLMGGSGVLNPSSLRFYDTFLFPVSRFLDTFTSPFFGKSVLLHAFKPIKISKDSNDNQK